MARKEPIDIDKNGWINPTCPYCECVMELNYSIWSKDENFIDKLPTLNMYCRYCHYAVKISPAIMSVDTAVLGRITSFEKYNSSRYEVAEE